MEASHTAISKPIQQQSNQSHHMTHMTQSQSFQTSASKEVLEHQLKIEMERQKQLEYEANQRRIVIEKDAHRNLIPVQAEENELKLQLERRRTMELQMAEQQG